MRTRQPIQSLSTEAMVRGVFPNSFKLVHDKSSNGYKYFNMLFGVELDQANEFLQHIYNQSFLTSMDFGEDPTVYEVFISGLSSQDYLNTTVSGAIPIKIVNNGSPGGEAEFWDGDPTRLITVGEYSFPSNVQISGHVIGFNYFRNNISGYGYFLAGTDLDQSEYSLSGSGSVWRFEVDTTGYILSYSGIWPGIATQDFDTAGEDEVLQPIGSGNLKKNYPMTRKVLDDSGVYWDIDHYEPYQGWVRDPYWGVVAMVDYPGSFYYDQDGKKIYYRTAFNNPYGSGNYITEYIRLDNIPISGTLKVYDIDILDISGNAIEIPSSGKAMYRLKSEYMLAGTGLAPGTAKFDPIYLGYDSTVPNEPRKFGKIAGAAANQFTTTSWDYQRGSGYLDEGTMQWVEGSGDITNMIKITNPYGRYMVEYKYKTLNKTNYITSPNATRYLSLGSLTPLYSIKGIFNNDEIIDYEFTRDKKFRSEEIDGTANPYFGEQSRYLTFDGWKIRPYSQMSKVDFNLPILIGSGAANVGAYQQWYTYIGYTPEFVPYYRAPRTTVIDCLFDEPVVTGSCTEADQSGSGNYLSWVNTGGNSLWLTYLNGKYAKTSRHIGASGYYTIDGTEFLEDNTYFSWDFRLTTPNDITLMELKEQTANNYIKVEIKSDGMLEITSNGSHVQSRYRFDFDNTLYSLIIQTTPDRDYTTNPLFNIYVKDSDTYKKLNPFSEDSDTLTVTGTYLHVLQNSTMDISRFKLWYEASVWQV